MKINEMADRLVGLTEKILTYRKFRKEWKKVRQKSLGAIMGWIDAFLWAVMVVILLNQYLLQAYQIPSGSMRNTLIGGIDPHTGRRSSSDRIFVDKVIFGPELLPGVGKLPGLREPRRAEVIIFENPEYESPSLAHEIAQRILYMATLSLVDLNRVRGGGTAHQFLIKRQTAEDGDVVKFERGELYFRPQGEDSFFPEEDFKNLANLEYGNHLLLDPAYYDKLAAVIEALTLEKAGLNISSQLEEQASAPWNTDLSKSMTDQYEAGRLESRIVRLLYPYNEAAAQADSRYRQGIYVPEGWLLPLGDNRSDSLDGRYFGPVSGNKILGRALFKYWPAGRIGMIR